VIRVNYPGLPGHPGHELAKRQMKAFGAMMSFEVKGGYEGGKRVMDGVKIFLRAASLGDTRSLIVHSASTSHRAVPPEQRKAIGITDGLVRLSVGIEAAEDLIQDLDQALMR
jgi:methionine-gamma-lyase